MPTAADILRRNGAEIADNEEEVIDKGDTGEGGNKPPADDDIDDQKLIASLNKKGIKVSSLDDLLKPAPTTIVLTPEEVEAQKKDKQQAAKRWALENKVVDEETLTSYERDLARGEEIAFDLFKDEFLEEIKGTDEEGSYNDEDIREIWDKINFAEDDDKSTSKKLRKKEIAKRVQNYINGKYGKVLNIEKEYDNVQAEENQARQYKGIVEQAVSKLPNKFPYTIDGVAVEYEPTAEAIERVKNIYLDPKAFKTLGGNGATPESIAAAMQKLIIDQDLNQFAVQIAQTYYKKKFDEFGKGRRGILDIDSSAGSADTYNPEDEDAPRARQLLNQNTKQV